MIRQTLEHISGVSIYPLISFTIFFIFFLILLVYVITLKKSWIEEVNRLPLEGHTPETPKKGGYPNV